MTDSGNKCDEREENGNLHHLNCLNISNRFFYSSSSFLLWNLNKNGKNRKNRKNHKTKLSNIYHIYMIYSKLSKENLPRGVVLSNLYWYRVSLLHYLKGRWLYNNITVTTHRRIFQSTVSLKRFYLEGFSKLWWLWSNSIIAVSYVLKCFLLKTLLVSLVAFTTYYYTTKFMTLLLRSMSKKSLSV